MKTYLENRIKALKEADSNACDKRWDMSKPDFERKLWREASNEITFARQELEQALNFLETSSVKDCSTCKHQSVSKYVKPCHGCRDNSGYDHYESKNNL